MSDDIYPLDDDDAHAQIVSMIDLHRGEAWWVAAPGDYQTFAVSAMTYAGVDRGELVALQFPARLNRSEVRATIQLLVHPDDALGLAKVLLHTGAWLRARAIVRRGDAR